MSRRRRVVENAFGILALRWQCLLSTMQQKLNLVQVIVKITMMLHNLMRSRYPVHHQVLMDREDYNGQITPGAWRQNANMHDIEQVRGPSREAAKAKKEREYLGCISTALLRGWYRVRYFLICFDKTFC